MDPALSKNQEIRASACRRCHLRQTAMRNFKPQPSAVSMDEATVVDKGALPLKVAQTRHPRLPSMTAGAFSVVVWRITRRVAGGITQALPSTEAQFGSVACTRTPADCGTQVSERPVYLCGSTIVCLFQAGRRQNISGREMFPAPFVFFWLGQPRPMIRVF
jgi:hypothetical protein